MGKLSQKVDALGAMEAVAEGLMEKAIKLRAEVMASIEVGDTVAGKKFSALFVSKKTPVLDTKTVLKLLPKSSWMQCVSFSLSKVRGFLGAKDVDRCISDVQEVKYLIIKKI